MSNQIISFGKYVSLSYSIVDDNGNVVEQHDLPIGFVYGSETELIGGMDGAIRGKQVGDEVEVKLPADDAFGPHDPELTFTDDLANVPSEFHRIGAEVQMQNDSGEAKTFYVTSIDEDKLTVDGNHPLAGKELTVKVNIIEVRNAEKGEDQVSGIHATQTPAGSPSIN